MRLKILLRRWRKYVERLPAEMATPAAHIDCAIRGCIIARGEQEEENARRILAGKLAQFEAACAGEPIAVDERGG